MKSMKGGFEINHIGIFSIGFFYYLLFPLVVGNWDLWPDGDFSRMWQSFYETVEKEKLLSGLGIIMFWYFCFIGGSLIIFKKKSFTMPAFRINYNIIPRLSLWGGLITFAGYLIYLFRSLLFTGYELVFNSTVEGGEWGGALGVITLAILIIYLADLIELRAAQLKTTKCFLNVFLFSFFLLAILIASMGSRTILFLGLISLIVAYSNVIKPITLKQLIATAFCGLIIFGGIGIWRVKGDFSMVEIITNTCGESMGTSFSYLYEINVGENHLFRSPVPFLTLFLNIVPTVILPGKEFLMQTTKMLNIDMYSPFGAESIYVGLMTYFGILGGGIFLFLLGIFMSWLYNRSLKNAICFVIYVFCAACLMTLLFRDPLQGSIVKYFVEIGILMPLILSPIIFTKTRVR